jgi:hypothetical protein
MASNILKYSIRDELLYGTVSNISFSMKAYSGGGRGSTAGAERADLAHWNTAKRAPGSYDEKNRGGPIPLGIYVASYYGVHPHLGRCAELTQTLSSLLQRDYESATGLRVTDRDGFFIHGRGPKGSDGCIVPSTKDELKALLDAIQAVAGPVVILVHSEGMDSEMLELAKRHGNAA